MPDGIYFVTFRLADSLPQRVLLRMQEDRQRALEALVRSGGRSTPPELARIADAFSERVESYLDLGKGSSLLRDAKAARIVADALHYFDLDRYKLHAWCVMPNHVHVIFRPLEGRGLSKIPSRGKASRPGRSTGLTGGPGCFGSLSIIIT
jgi:hypothetical protein